MTHGGPLMLEIWDWSIGHQKDKVHGQSVRPFSQVGLLGKETCGD